MYLSINPLSFNVRILDKYVWSPIAFTSYGDAILLAPFIIIYELFISAISDVFIILEPFIDIASAPAYLSSFTKSTKYDATPSFSPSS